MATVVQSYTLSEGGNIDVKVNEGFQMGPFHIEKTKKDGGNIYLFIRYRPEKSGFNKLDFNIRRWNRPHPDAMGSTTGDREGTIVFESHELSIWEHDNNYNLIFTSTAMNHHIEYFRLYWYPD